MSTTAASPYALSLGNDFPVTIVLRSFHGATLTGRAIRAYLALTEGGDAIDDPVTTVDLQEDATSPETARRYRGTIQSSAVDAVLALGQGSYWLAIEDPDDFRVWERVPVIRHRRAA